MKLEALIRPNIKKMKPYSSARDEYSGADGIFLDANENPYETGLNRYPDPYQREIKTNLAAIKAIDPRKIFLGNGSDEPIDLLIRIFCEPGSDKIITLDPSYGMYGVAAAINNVTVVRVPLTENFELNADEVIRHIDPNVKIIFLCSPNNPSGNLLNKDEVRKIIRMFPGIVVIDEAYIDFSGDPGFLPELDEHPHLVILQTFSKAWGLAGLRIGMTFASPRIIHYLNKVKPPYNINVLSQQKALDSLRNRGKVGEEIRSLIDARSALIKQLAQHPLVEKIFPSDSNFILIRFTAAPAVFAHLIKNGIIVRDRTSVKHGENCLRISVGTEQENEKLLNTLADFKPL